MNSTSTNNPEVKLLPYVIIMAGGIGSRFWPASRIHKPKQFLDILGTGHSLLQMTAQRFERHIPAEHFYILTHNSYIESIQEQLPFIPNQNIIPEPQRKNTAPCIAAMARILWQRTLDKDACMLILPSDHIILKEDVFLHHIQLATEFIQKHSALVTLGITPNRPDTGYGYIHYDKEHGYTDLIYPVLEFVEKPDATSAQAFVDSNHYLWNAGIFLFKLDDIIKAFQHYAPDIWNLAETTIREGNADELQMFYEQVREVSIDYAIMEQASNVVTIPSDMGWSDLGTWDRWHQEAEKDAHSNVVIASKIILDETQGCVIRVPEDKLCVIRGLEDFIVIDENDILLIYPRSKEQEIKQINAQVGRLFGDQFI